MVSLKSSVRRLQSSKFFYSIFNEEMSLDIDSNTTVLNIALFIRNSRC